MPILSFKSFDEVIERANNNELGLASYVCTNSMEKAHRASELLETGTVAVNTPVVAIAEAPFGGIKQSGYGREGGSMAIKDYLDEMYRSSIKYDITDDAGNVVETIETWTTKNIVAGDLVVGSLLKQLRDLGTAGREIADLVDLDDIDGPAKQVVDTMLTALYLYLIHISRCRRRLTCRSRWSPYQ